MLAFAGDPDFPLPTAAQWQCSVPSLITETTLSRHYLMEDAEQLRSPLFALHRPVLCLLHRVPSS